MERKPPVEMHTMTKSRAVERRPGGRWSWPPWPWPPWRRSACGPAPPFWAAAPGRCPGAPGACRPGPGSRRGRPSARVPTDSCPHRRSSRWSPRRHSTVPVVRSLGRRAPLALAAVFAASGTVHLVRPQAFAAIMPRVIPQEHHTSLIYVSGVAELASRGGARPASPLGARRQRGHTGRRLPGQRADGTRRRLGPQRRAGRQPRHRLGPAAAAARHGLGGAAGRAGAPQRASGLRAGASRPRSRRTGCRCTAAPRRTRRCGRGAARAPAWARCRGGRPRTRVCVPPPRAPARSAAGHAP